LLHCWHNSAWQAEQGAVLTFSALQAEQEEIPKAVGAGGIVPSFVGVDDVLDIASEFVASVLVATAFFLWTRLKIVRHESNAGVLSLTDAT